MVRRFAEGTSVPVDRSQAEVKKLLKAHGAGGILVAEQGEHTVLMFELEGRRVRFDVAPPGKEFDSVRKRAAEERRRWRALILLLKAKFESIASGDAGYEAEFLAYFTLPDGRTPLIARVLPELDKALTAGKVPPLLPP